MYSWTPHVIAYYSHMFTYVYICLFIVGHVSNFSVDTYIYLYIYIYTHTYTSVFVYVHMHMYIGQKYLYTCVFVYAYNWNMGLGVGAGTQHSPRVHHPSLNSILQPPTIKT